MSQKHLHHVAGRLSLRAPQRESLEALATAIAATPDMLNPKPDVKVLLDVLKSEFPKLSDLNGNSRPCVLPWQPAWAKPY